MPPVSHSVQLQHAWNPNDQSTNLTIKANDPMTVRRLSTPQTDCIRTKLGYTNGIHVWEIKWNASQRGTNCVIGVATENSPLSHKRYQNLIGIDYKSKLNI